MTRSIAGIAALLLACATISARAQSAAAWPRVGTKLVRVEEALMPSTPGATREACATRLRDPRTGREYMLRHSTRKEKFAQQKAGTTTTTTTELLHAVGEYARLDPKSDTLSTRVVTVDCITSRVSDQPH